MKILFLLLVLGGLSAGAVLSGSGMPPAPVQSSATFRIHNAGLPVNGTISGIEAEIKFNPADLTHSRIAAQANVTTLQTGIAIRDKHLQNSDYFDTPNHPRIYLVSKAFRRISKDRYWSRFDLTIKGITKEITIPFRVRRANKDIIYQGSFTLNRLDFQLGEKSPILAEEVRVSLEGKMLQ